MPRTGGVHTPETKERLMADGDAGQFYWCLRHERVESTDRCGAEMRMGPYATAEEAQAYSEKAKARNEAWAEEDERWSGD